MQLRRHVAAWIAAAGLTMGAAQADAAATNIIYILDASNSMWGQIDGTAKIETARGVMGNLLEDVNADIALGLMVYGHRSEGACDDIELVAPVGSSTPAQITAALAEIKPKGKTPIAGALEAAGAAFPTNDANNNVVLISDGIETCEGDPCAVAGALASAGVKTKIHAIGFDVDEAAREQLECIAKAGNGSYYNASNAEELTIAVAEVQEVVEAAPEPAPEPEPEPTASQFFFDDFDGELSEDWVVNNPNLDAYIVEDSNVMMLNSAPAGFGTEGAQNLVVLKRDLPDGDWDASVTFKGEFKTGVDNLWFGLYKDTANYLGAQFWAEAACCGCSNVAIRNIKSSNGEATLFDVPLRGNVGCGGPGEAEFNAVIERMVDTAAKITLHKRGRSYHVTMDLGETTDEGDPILYETDPLTSLRVPGELAFTIGKFKDAGQGEALVFIDSVEITSLSE